MCMRTRRLSVAQSLLLWCVVALLVWLDGRASSVVVRAEFGGPTYIGIINLISRLFGQQSGAQPSFIMSLIAGLRYGLTNLAEQVVNYARENAGFWSRFVGAMRRFRDVAIVPLLKWLRAQILEIRRWLRRIAGPLFRLIWRLRREWLTFYVKVLRPILDTIAALRLALNLLKAVGVKGAEKLDAYLGEVEGWIDREFRRVLGLINRIEDRVYRVITLDYLIERVALVRSIWRDVHPVFAAMENFRRTPLTAADLDALSRENTPPSRQTHATEFTRFLVSRDGPLASRYADVNLTDTIFTPSR